MVDRQNVQVEASYAHDGVVCVFLVADGEVGCLVPDEGEIVVARVDRLEEGRASGEQRYVLDVRIMFLRAG